MGIVKWIRSKSKIYLIAITTIISITLINQVIIQFVLQKKKSAVHVVNLAGRQRMLSQRIVKDAYRVAMTGDDGRIAALKAMCDEWNDVNKGLQFGSKELGLPELKNEEIRALFGESDKYQQELYQMISGANSAETIKSKIDLIDWNGEHFLQAMEKIVAAFEHRDIPFQNLILIELALAVIALLIQLLEVLFIFSPLFVKLQKQNRHLVEIAFRQSHEVRAHVCTIRGLINIFDKSNLNEENRGLLKLMSNEAEGLDDVTSGIVAKTNYHVFERPI